LLLSTYSLPVLRVVKQWVNIKSRIKNRTREGRGVRESAWASRSPLTTFKMSGILIRSAIRTAERLGAHPEQLSVCLSVCLSLSLGRGVCVCVCVCVCPVSVSVSVSVCLSRSRVLSLYLSLALPVCLSDCLFVYLSVSLGRQASSSRCSRFIKVPPTRENQRIHNLE